jgi:hypothetical protein
MRQLKDRPPFNDPARRDQFHEKLTRLPGLRVTDAGMEGFPAIPLESVTDPKAMQELLSTLDWLIGELHGPKNGVE